MAPKGIPDAAGPSRSWGWYKARVPREELVGCPIQFSVAKGASRHDLTVRCLCLSWAFEDLRLDVAAVSENRRSRFHVRGAPPTFARLPAVGPSRPGAVYNDPSLCFCSSFIFRLREGMKITAKSTPGSLVACLAGVVGCSPPPLAAHHQFS